MDETVEVCPNCGAPIVQNRFLAVCRYCGTALVNSTPLPTPDKRKGNSSKKRYEYIVANEETITQNPNVVLQKNGAEYVITSTSFYSNDGSLDTISIPHWRLRFQSGVRTEKMMLGICAKRPASRMAIQMDGDQVLPLQPVGSSDGYTWFDLTIDQLLSICTTKAIDLTSDVLIPANAHFDELPIFASRFYNIAFDRMKFMYSKQVQLITDN